MFLRNRNRRSIFFFSFLFWKSKFVETCFLKKKKFKKIWSNMFWPFLFQKDIKNGEKKRTILNSLGAIVRWATLEWALARPGLNHETLQKNSLLLYCALTLQNLKMYLRIKFVCSYPINWSRIWKWVLDFSPSIKLVARLLALGWFIGVKKEAKWRSPTSGNRIISPLNWRWEMENEYPTINYLSIQPKI